MASHPPAAIGYQTILLPFPKIFKSLSTRDITNDSIKCFIGNKSITLSPMPDEMQGIRIQHSILPVRRSIETQFVVPVQLLG